jgi:polyphosphate glucokinase
MSHAIGVDVGGTGIKAAVVDTATGELLVKRRRLDTPRPATPEAVRDTIVELVNGFGVTAPVGVALPAIVRNGVALSAANIDPSWVGISLPELLDDALPGPAAYLNDADAAGLAETEYGAGKGQRGLVLTITLGTGIGAAMVYDGTLIPNAEFGHLELDGAVAETTTSARAREALGLDWERWAARVSRYLRHLDRLLSPDLFLLGGGVSKTPEPWFHLIEVDTPVRLATLINNAGIIGSAHAATTAR